jgi:hypothetical protein
MGKDIDNNSIAIVALLIIAICTLFSGIMSAGNIVSAIGGSLATFLINPTKQGT